MFVSKYLWFLRFCSPIVIVTLSMTGHTARGQTTETISRISDSFEELVGKVSPSVVQIQASGYGFTGGATTEGLVTRRRSGGSGVILHEDGYIATNAHVVEGAERVQVILPLAAGSTWEGTSTLKPRGQRVGAQVIGIDRETDLAVIKVQAKNLPALELADSDELRQGQIVLAFGSPFGLENSVSMGVVSSVARQLSPEDPMIYIQTDATINPGNSGGPLVDTDGRVVGINTMILSHAGGSEGVGFAAPSNIVRNIFTQFRATGRVRRGQIGVFAQTITPTMADGLGLDRDWGVMIGDVYPDGPADKAGLKIGDVVLTMNGKTMENGRQLEVNLYGRPVGEKVTLEIMRGSERKTIEVPVIERADDPARFINLANPEKNLVPSLGVLCLDLTRPVLQMMPPLRIDGGVVVAARAADAPYANDGLLPGDVIHQVNGNRIRDLKALQAEIDKLRSGSAAVFQVERGGRLKFVAFEID